ncbi:AbrB/MazE/SpoVT family DNA-binding domain-containing protein [Actinoplanes aureus]|uniref:AbrB/MazE/SpoVT family DNA-binding domain-containing protein n=1 Tax=Actinoplanes aureus TaxID=2792083 RepID=A0A931CFL3_9ACTN|nr:AbrB/MazE/SpoVT family DNA-binding domain-containing protein [Actinoplanes aureus]MBG0564010.1 AbrB/MazE/SpoVT family DNA-binding domain-containing protein [Actinoplanes aureus]
MAVTRVDAHGRLASRRQFSELQWEHGHVVELHVADSGVIMAGKTLPRAEPIEHVKATVGSSGHLVLPATIRRQARIDAGDQLLLVADGPTLWIYPAQLATALLRSHAPSAGADT